MLDRRHGSSSIIETPNQERNVMYYTRSLCAAIVALSIALAPAIADARAGGRTSMGSRGSMTNSAPPTTRTAPETAQPMQRTITPSAPTSRPAANMPAVPSRSSSFMSGLAGGLIGVGLGGLLFGHGFFGSGLGGIGFLGLLLQIGLVALAVWFVVRLFRSRQVPALAGGPNIFARGKPDRPASAVPFSGRSGGSPSVSIGPSDYGYFERLLKTVQSAWSAHDPNALRAVTTPEMLSYFSEQLSEQVSRGHRNRISDVRLESGDLAQSWSEHGKDYATVAMRFSMIDVTYDQSGRVVDGHPSERDVATELWTFVRASGGQWLLSAIQQTRT